MKHTRFLFFFICWAGTYAIADASAEYLRLDVLSTDFLLEKLPLSKPELFVWVLRAHVVSAVFSLPACLLLQSVAILKRAPTLHRLLGRVTCMIVLTLLVPSGIYLAFFARAGFWSTIGFLLSGTIVATSTVWGIQSARARNFGIHRLCMRHLFAQLSVAVSSRILLVAFEETSLDTDVAYLIALWVPVIGSALIAQSPKFNFLHRFTPTRTGVTP